MNWLRVHGQDHKVSCESPLSCSPCGAAHPTHALRRASVTSCESGRGHRDSFQRRACGSLEGGLAGAQAQTAIDMLHYLTIRLRVAVAVTAR